MECLSCCFGSADKTPATNGEDSSSSLTGHPSEKSVKHTQPTPAGGPDRRIIDLNPSPSPAPRPKAQPAEAEPTGKVTAVPTQPPAPQKPAPRPVQPTAMQTQSPPTKAAPVVSTQGVAAGKVTAMEALISPQHQGRVRNYEQLMDDYRVVKKLSNGTCAVVLLGLHGTTGEKVAIKRQEKKGRNINQIAREADIHFAVGGHPNIAQLLEVSEGPTEIILVQEFCGGGELFDAVTPEIGCAPNVARAYVLQLLSGLHYLHEGSGVAHRDIKPENIMLTPDKRTVKIIDFGLAERVGPSGSKYKRRVGTVPYMDPCLWSSREDEAYGELDVKAIDVWAAGVVLFCMLCGRFPWAEATQRSAEFRKYLEGDFGHFPWNRLGAVQLALLRGMLCVDAARRLTAKSAMDFVEHHWAPITASEHKQRIKADLRVLAAGPQGPTADIVDGARGSVASPLTLSPVANVNSNTSFDFDEAVATERHSGVKASQRVPPTSRAA